NKRRDRQKNILIAAGLFDPAKHKSGDVDELFENVEAAIIDLDRGEYLTEDEIRDILNVEEISDYDQALAANVPPISYTLGTADDIAGIQRRENYSFVYLVKEGNEVKQLILPIRGYGLWSTLFGFVAIDAQSLGQGPEKITISGLKYYQHQETP